MPVGTASLTYVDYDGQKGQMSINTAPITAANIAAISTAMDTLKTETDVIVDGLGLAKHLTQVTYYAGQSANSPNDLAQRGNKWLVSYTDNTPELAVGVPNPYYRKPFQFEIPTAKISLRFGGQNIVFNRGSSASNPQEFVDWVAAAEAVAKSPVGGDAQIELIEAVTTSGG